MSTLTIIDFVDECKWSSRLERKAPITVLFRSQAFGFAIGDLRSISEWRLALLPAPKRELYFLELIEVTSNGKSAVYHIQLGEVLDDLSTGKRMTLTTIKGGSSGYCVIQGARSKRPRIQKGIEALSTGIQRQDSTSDQLRDVCKLAVAAGCYDAEDWIKARM